MAYATTSWNIDDEITQQRLQQMSDNDTYLHDQQPSVNFADSSSALVGSAPSSASRVYLKTGFNIGFTDGNGDIVIAFATSFSNGLIAVNVTLAQLDSPTWNAVTPKANFLTETAAARAATLGGFRARIYNPATGNSSVATGNYGICWTAIGW